MAATSSVEILQLGLCDYQPMLERMRQFTDTRTSDSPDQLWCLQHQPVFTLGQAGDPDHVLAAGDIPLVQSDRGGQVTYHGPGQLVIYTLINLKRYSLGVRSMVSLLENAVIEFLAGYSVDAVARPDAPGVYVGERKIAALGLRVRRGCTFHGLSLNVDMDLEPFSRINPCGYAGLATTQLAEYAPRVTVESAADKLSAILRRELAQLVVAAIAKPST